MRIGSWLALWGALAGACGGSSFPEEGQTCGPNGECAPGLLCDPITNTCVRRGSNLTVTITSPSDGGSTLASGTVAFTSVGGTRYECQLDQTTVTCAAPGYGFTGLPDGSHRFTVLAFNAAGEASDPATVTFTVDTTPPVVLIASPSANGAGCTNQQVAFDTDPPGERVRFECSLDEVPFSTCAPGTTYIDLEPGPHTVRVRATDEAGNVGTETSVTFTVDPRPLSAKVDSVTPGASNDGTATIAYSTNKLPAGIAAGVLLVDPAAQTPVLVPSCTCAGGSCACSQLPAGPISVGVRADDACGGSVLAAGPVTATYGPYDGHAVLIGHDIGDAAVPGALLTNAVTLAPFLHHNLGFTRPLRVLAFRGGLAADDPGRARALDLLRTAIAGFDAADATQYLEITSASQIGALAGRDVFLVYDQRDALSAAELTSAGTQWGPLLQPFLTAGGVVVVLSGIDGAGGPSPTYLVLRGQTPVMPINNVSRGGGNVQATYPDALGTNYWLTRTVGASYTAPASSCFNDVTSGPAEPTVVYHEVHIQCGDGCTSSVCPVVVDKLFGSYLVSASPNGVPVTFSTTTYTYTGPGGTGSYSLEPSSVPSSGGSCYLFPTPGLGTQPADRTPCSITGPRTWSFSGLGDGDWTAVITLLDARGEPARASVTQNWVVDAQTDTSILPPAANATVVTYFIGYEPTYYQSVTCRLYRMNGSTPVELSVKPGLACGARLVPGTSLFDAGYFMVNWSGNFSMSGTYRMTLTATDGVGNVSPIVSADWSYST
jgi:hypothetical protein